MIKNFIFTIVCMLLIMNTEAQTMKLSTKSKKAEKQFQNAVNQYKLQYYEAAVDFLKEAIDEDERFIDAYFMLSQTFEDMRKDTLAIENAKKAMKINPNYFPSAYYNLSLLEFNNGFYTEALQHINKYLSYSDDLVGRKQNATFLKNKILYSIAEIKKPVKFQPKNLGEAINSKQNEYWPRLSADENLLIYTRLLPKEIDLRKKKDLTQEDFFISKTNIGKWQPSEPMGAPINTLENEGAHTISPDGKLIIFTRCGGGSFCDLYFSKNENGKWTEPQSIGTNINTRVSEKQPSLSPDGKKLYFSSNRVSGKGGWDIWCSTLADNGLWGAPINLGDSVNTPYDEYSPFMHLDNQSLYFASTGWMGFGRYDIFVSKQKENNQWTTPKNLGYPVNTCFEEVGLIVNAQGDKAYYSSNRVQNGFGGDDIYSFDLPREVQPKSVSYMKGNVFDVETNDPLPAKFELIDLATAKTVMNAQANDDGTFLVCIPSGKEYALNVNNSGYLFYSDNFTLQQTDNLQPFKKDVPLKPIKIGETVVLRNIFFETDKYELKVESKIELNILIDLLTKNTLLQIEIGGHTDNVGKKEYNQKLSENRAQSVKNYLIENGIEAKRLSSKGYGSDKPLDDNTTDEGKAKNRRTEFKVIGN